MKGMQEEEEIKETRCLQELRRNRGNKHLVRGRFLQENNCNILAPSGLPITVLKGLETINWVFLIK